MVMGVKSCICTYFLHDLNNREKSQICYCEQMKKQKHEVFPHFSVEVLRERYLECECPRERTHWHIIWLLADTTHSRTPREVAEPELQPAERLWSLFREVVVNKVWTTLSALEEVLVKGVGGSPKTERRCRHMSVFSGFAK